MSVYVLMIFINCFLTIFQIRFAAILIGQDCETISSQVKLPLKVLSNMFNKNEQCVKYIFMCIGFFILLLIMIGALGYVIDSTFVLAVYIFLTGILAIFHLALGIRMVTQRDAIKKLVDSFVIESYFDRNMISLHRIEARFHCCGTYGPDFYLSRDGVDYVSPSCCPNQTFCSKSMAFQNGCSIVIRKNYEQQSNNWGRVFVLVSVIQMGAAATGFYFAYIIYNDIDRPKLKETSGAKENPAQPAKVQSVVKPIIRNTPDINSG